MGFSTSCLTKLYPVLLRITLKESESKAYAVETTEAFKKNSDFASILVFHQLSYKKKKCFIIVGTQCLTRLASLVCLPLGPQLTDKQNQNGLLGASLSWGFNSLQFGLVFMISFVYFCNTSFFWVFGFNQFMFLLFKHQIAPSNQNEINCIPWLALLFSFFFFSTRRVIHILSELYWCRCLCKHLRCELCLSC